MLAAGVKGWGTGVTSAPPTDHTHIVLTAKSKEGGPNCYPLGFPRGGQSQTLGDI